MNIGKALRRQRKSADRRIGWKCVFYMQFFFCERALNMLEIMMLLWFIVNGICQPQTSFY